MWGDVPDDIMIVTEPQRPIILASGGHQAYVLGTTYEPGDDQSEMNAMVGLLTGLDDDSTETTMHKLSESSVVSRRILEEAISEGRTVTERTRVIIRAFERFGEGEHDVRQVLFPEDDTLTNVTLTLMSRGPLPMS